MEEIIVIRTSDPDGSIFRSIIEALQGKNVQILHAADLEPFVMTLGDIEIFPEQRRVMKQGMEIHLNYGEFSILTAWPAALGVYSAGSSFTMRPGARTMN